MEVKAVVGANEGSDLEGSKRNRRGGNIRSTFSSNMDMRVCGCATAGSGYYRYAERQYDIKNKKRAVGIVYSLFFLTVILTAAITESKPTSAISPIGVSAGTDTPPSIFLSSS